MERLNSFEIEVVAAGNMGDIVATGVALGGGIAAVSTTAAVAGTGMVLAAGAGGYLLGGMIYDEIDTELGDFIDGVVTGLDG